MLENKERYNKNGILFGIPGQGSNTSTLDHIIKSIKSGQTVIIVDTDK